ncbi:MAG: putative Rieske-type ferredoxin [Caulobacteraceae bacterium]|jgi:nitrite reductase/ring-hydroxylating ferredoxin subunit|nr:putative Rieske-type ferredoxin [Caulobacteraceae bacterium]
MSWLTDRLTRLLAEGGLTVEVVARQLAIERSRLANIVAGAAVPNESLTRRIARLFGEDADEWLNHIHKRADETPAAARPPTDFTKVAKVAEVPEGAMRIVFEGLAVIARVEGQLHAFGNACPHAGGALGEGLLKGCVVKCPWHAGRWDVTTGKALTLLETAAIPIFDVRVVGDDIEIRLEDGVVAAPASAPPNLQKTPG